MDIICRATAELPKIATQFVREMGDESLFAFYGSMGAGKTTFISEICRELGCEDAVTSPTFSIVNEYVDANGTPVYHFDFYRIETPQEAVDIGLDDYLSSGYPCFIEWPERIGNLLPPDAVRVEINEQPDGSRSIRTSKAL